MDMDKKMDQNNPTQRDYAGIFVRFVAMIIDALIISIPGFVLGIATSGLGGIVVYFAYKAVWEASAVQGTPGKRAMGIIVTDLNGQRLDFKSSLIRCTVSFLSASTMGLGHLVAFFTDKKQTVHDLMSDSIVTTGETKAPLIDSWLVTTREILGKTSQPS